MRRGFLKVRAARLASARGEILIEAAVAFTLLGVVVLGLAQQFALIDAQLKHEKVATEVLLGPQGATLVFNNTTSEFEPLSDALRVPFLDDIAGFAGRRGGGESTSVAVALGYLKIDPKSGVVLDKVVPDGVGTSLGMQSTRCRSGLEKKLIEYAEAQLTQMQDYTPADGNRVPVGPKLYDVTVAGTRYQGFVDYLPFLICSEPAMGPLSIAPTSYYTISPRRLVN
jgi:hypothetical protein